MRTRTRAEVLAGARARRLARALPARERRVFRRASRCASCSTPARSRCWTATAAGSRLFRRCAGAGIAGSAARARRERRAGRGGDVPRGRHDRAVRLAQQTAVGARARDARPRRVNAAGTIPQLAGARSYDEFIVVAHPHGEAGGTASATDPDFDDESGSDGAAFLPLRQNKRRSVARAVAEATRRSSRDADAESTHTFGFARKPKLVVFDGPLSARFVKKRFFSSTRFFPSSNEGRAEPHDASDARRVSSLKRYTRSAPVRPLKKGPRSEKLLCVRGTTRCTTNALIEACIAFVARGAPSGVEEMMFSLRADILRNIGNLADIGRRLHEPLWGAGERARVHRRCRGAAAASPRENTICR